MNTEDDTFKKLKKATFSKALSVYDEICRELIYSRSPNATFETIKADVELELNKFGRTLEELNTEYSNSFPKMYD